jgi:dienelactone hydrolase
MRFGWIFRMFGRRWFWAAVAITASLYGIGTAFYEWDPTRAMWKRWRAKSPYQYELAAPRYFMTNPADLITAYLPEDAKRLRQDLIAAVFGPAGLPLERLPDSIETGISDPRFDGLAGLDGIDRIVVEFAEGGWSRILHLRPRDKSQRVVLFHDGHGAGGLGRHTGIFEKLLSAGHDVLVLALPGLSGNGNPGGYLPRVGWYSTHPWRILDLRPYPLRFWMEPPVVAINYALAELDAVDVTMMGFSAGGWVTTVAAAIDDRIKASYPVAGTYPLYIRAGDEAKQSPRPQYHAPMIRAANYLEMYALAADGAERRQIQILNRYDRCCYNGIKGRLYEDAVRDAVAAIGGGAFSVFIDESHPRHKVSSLAIKTILADMNKAGMEKAR